MRALSSDTLHPPRLPVLIVGRIILRARITFEHFFEGDENLPAPSQIPNYDPSALAEDRVERLRHWLKNETVR